MTLEFFADTVSAFFNADRHMSISNFAMLRGQDTAQHLNSSELDEFMHAYLNHLAS